jgi:outer membrane protein|tara:strand:+ start:191 stop:616 length:426 start_codon:yes stop_codon:yes gene_type:complete
MEKILNESTSGKKYLSELSKSNKSLLEEIKIKEKILIQKEKLLFSKKNIINKDEFDKELKLLKQKIIDHNNTKDIELKKIKKNQQMMTIKLLEAINPILTEYSTKNSISIMLQKKNIVIGDTRLDITSKILEIINTKITLE